MGIRINKSMGWILVNKHVDLYTLEETTVGDLLTKYPNDQYLKMDLQYPGVKSSTSLSSFVNDASDETDDGNSDSPASCLIFTPPSSRKDWHRHGDYIDYYESKSMSLQIQYLHTELFPYAENMIITKTLHELTPVESKWASYGWTMLNQLTKDKMESYGFDTSLPMNEQVHMKAPRIIQVMSDLAGIPNSAELRPAIVTYWR